MEGRLLRDALGHLPAHLISREPLGSGTVAGFAVGDDQPSTTTYFVDTSRLAVSRETGLAHGDDPKHPDARIWLHPADPHLPALAAAAFGHAAEALLARLGLVACGPIHMVGYRPGRRAVLRASVEDGDAWIKVVRPSRVARIVRAHRACVDAGLPVPDLRGWSPDGLLVLDAASGVPASERDSSPTALLSAVDDLRGQVERIPWSEPIRSIASRLPWYAARLDREAEGALAVELITSRLASVTPHAHITVHGDLHYGQLFFQDGEITGLIDVDGLGRGAPAEDPAAFIAHAIASAHLTPDPYAQRVWELADAALARWEEDPAVRPYAAIHLLGHAIAAGDLGDRTGADLLIECAIRLVEGGAASRDPGKNPLTHRFESA